MLNVLWIAEQTSIVKEAAHVTFLLAWRFVLATLSLGFNFTFGWFQIKI